MCSRLSYSAHKQWFFLNNGSQLNQGVLLKTVYIPVLSFVRAVALWASWSYAPLTCKTLQNFLFVWIVKQHDSKQQFGYSITIHLKLIIRPFWYWKKSRTVTSATVASIQWSRILAKWTFLLIWLPHCTKLQWAFEFFSFLVKVGQSFSAFGGC